MGLATALVPTAWLLSMHGQYICSVYGFDSISHSAHLLQEVTLYVAVDGEGVHIGTPSNCLQLTKTSRSFDSATGVNGTTGGP